MSKLYFCHHGDCHQGDILKTIIFHLILCFLFRFCRCVDILGIMVTFLPLLFSIYCVEGMILIDVKCHRGDIYHGDITIIWTRSLSGTAYYWGLKRIKSKKYHLKASNDWRSSILVSNLGIRKFVVTFIF